MVMYSSTWTGLKCFGKICQQVYDVAHSWAFGIYLQENMRLEAEVKRLTKIVVSDIPPKEREVLDEALKSNERLQADKDEVMFLKKALLRKLSDAVF